MPIIDMQLYLKEHLLSVFDCEICNSAYLTPLSNPFLEQTSPEQ